MTIKCSSTKTLNPKTGRCVSKKGKLGDKNIFRVYRFITCGHEIYSLFEVTTDMFISSVLNPNNPDDVEAFGALGGRFEVNSSMFHLKGLYLIPHNIEEEEFIPYFILFNGKGRR